MEVGHISILYRNGHNIISLVIRITYLVILTKAVIIN